ncbi:ATP-binding protein [Novosphingobium sp.]|uniref:sensor histidine kinase n=1 Tax=Novosphingobium sp. TaxID=1874826 RepID=UPI0035B2E25A
MAIAFALLLAQGISAVLLYRAQADRREAALVHTAALRLFAAGREEGRFGGEIRHGPEFGGRQLKVELLPASPLVAGDDRRSHAEDELREILEDQGAVLGQVVVVQRPTSEDPRLAGKLEHRTRMLGDHAPPPPDHVLLAAVELQPAGGGWLAVRIPVPGGERALLASLLGQTLLLYGLLVGAIALILGRITRPLAALTRRLERFAQTRDIDGQLEPQGPDDIRSLIVAHNAMEGRIAALLDEKDVMLGAIGHDLKTPLAALRVRIECVDDESERAKMAATIEDITRSLDDILSLARVGRPSDPREPTELSALVAHVAEEFEDMGEPVTFAPSERIVLSLRPTWLRRAVRNLVSNALRYAGSARITLERQGDSAVVRVEDDGPGIPDGDIERMLEPFTRGDPSRNSGTGGAGLGLTLARAIAEQHGGKLHLANRRGADGAVAGLTATISLPIT